jgi:nucleoside-diphosphate-sugar epimerase
MSNVLVTGGNGFVGRHVVAVLQDRGNTVRVLALPGEDTHWLSQRGVAVCWGDVRDPAAVAAAIRGTDAVLHLAAMMDVWRPMRDYHAVNVTGTQNVCRAALAEGVRRLVHMSSSSVYGMALRPPVDESFPLAPFPDPYPVTKAAGDRVVQRMIVENQLPAVIVRPDQIFGPGDRLHFGRMADRLRAGRSIVVGPGDNALPFVYVTDAVQGLLLALDHPNAVGQAFNITNDSPLTQQQILEAIARETGARPPRRHVSYQALYAAAYVAERLGSLSHSPRRPPLTRLGVAFLGTENRYAIGKARSTLGFRPMVSLLHGIRLAAMWYGCRDHSQPMLVPALGQVTEGVRS